MNIKIIICALAVSFFAFSACDDSSTEPNDKPTVKVYSELSDTQTMSVELKKIADIALGDRVDSVKISKVRILISRIMLHLSGKADNDSKLFKTGPYVLTGDLAAGTYELTSGAVEEGTYDKVKFEMHRFSSEELSTYASNETFKDFATGDRFSVIIDGVIYNGTESEDFTYKGTVTDNQSLSFNPALVLKENAEYKVYFQINPTVIFKDGEFTFDPRDSKNANDIDNALKSAVRALFK